MSLELRFYFNMVKSRLCNFKFKGTNTKKHHRGEGGFKFWPFKYASRASNIELYLHGFLLYLPEFKALDTRHLKLSPPLPVASSCVPWCNS